MEQITGIRRDMSAIDLYCGVGGMTHGFILEGIRVIAGVDADPSCRYAFVVNNRSLFIEKNIEDVTGEELLELYPENTFKILMGCAPCQPFSKYTRRASKDDKWKLLEQFSRLIEEVDPDVVSMENVPGLATGRGRDVFNNYVERLNKDGYSVFHNIIFCPDFGVPQARKRLVLLASKHGPIQLIPNTHTSDNYQTVGNTIRHLPPLRAGAMDQNDPLHRACMLSETNMKRIKASTAGSTWRDWPPGLAAACHKRPTGRSYPSVYGRMSWEKPSPTITTQAYGYGNGRFGHPEQDRAISLREAALLQTFPFEYDLLDPDRIYALKEVGRHIGNAVPVKLARVIARSIKLHLEACLDY